MALRNSSALNLRLKSSGLDKWLSPDPGYKVDVHHINNSYLEQAIYKLFYVDVIRQIQIKAIIAKQFHIPPFEIDRMPYWEYELWMRELNDQVKEENDAQQEQLDKYHINDTMSSISSGKFMSGLTPKMPAMPKMPSFGTMKTPF